MNLTMFIEEDFYVKHIKENLLRLIAGKNFSEDAREILTGIITSLEKGILSESTFEALIMRILSGLQGISYRELWFCFNDTHLERLPLNYQEHDPAFGVVAVVYYIPEENQFVQIRRSACDDHAFWIRTVGMCDLMRAQKILPEYPEDLRDLYFVSFDITEKELFVYDDDFEEGAEPGAQASYESFCKLLRNKTPLFVEQTIRSGLLFGNETIAYRINQNFARRIWGEDTKWLTATKAPAFFQEFAEERGLIPKTAAGD